MKQFTVNIGLNNNPFNEKHQVSLIFNKLIEFSGGTLIDTKFKVGKYNHLDEPTAIIEFKVKDESVAHEIVKLATVIFNQECIPVSSNDRTFNELVYNYNFEGERYEFDYEYFMFIDRLTDEA